MRLHTFSPLRQPVTAPQRRRGFTLVESLVVSALLIVLMTGVIGAHLFGLRLQRISETKLSATASARHALNQVRDEIRSAKSLLVGTGNADTFTPIADNAAHIGNALQVYATTNTSNFIRFYLDSDAHSLKRITSADDAPRVVANYVTNSLVFRAEDFQGNVLTNNQNNRIIRMVLEFYQWEFPVATVGTGGLYDYYRLQTRITRRAIE